MNGYEPSKDRLPAAAPGYPPGYPPAYGAEPMPSPSLDQNYPGPANNMYIPPTAPQYAGNYPAYNTGYPQVQNVVVTSQPTVMMTAVRVQEKDYLGYSIFTLLCCCLPIGIAALIYSMNTREANNRGDSDTAHRNSRTALTLNNVALGLGIAITIVWVSCVIYVKMAVQTYYNNYYV